MDEEDKILACIEQKVKKRREVLDRGRDPEASARLESEIAQLYGDLRAARAQDVNGHRSDIVRRARVERELEKLMTSD